ncbi:hypothetical protein [Bradyrhizobium sp. Ai1a-2]|nr:hypothetical protein [Bradyrhizobium sp. Ai1a-2]
MMAVNDGGFAPVVVQKHHTQPSAFTPEKLQLIAIAADRLRFRLLP